jgi:hypothetical protein
MFCHIQLEISRGSRECPFNYRITESFKLEVVSVEFEMQNEQLGFKKAFSSGRPLSKKAGEEQRGSRRCPRSKNEESPCKMTEKSCD